MNYGNLLISMTIVLRAEPSDTNPNGKNLVFERPSAFSPSPAYLNGTVQQLNSSAGDFAYLNFVNDDKDKKDDFGVYLPDVGDGPGFTDSVSASLGIGNAAFNIAANRVYGQLHAAPNTFLGCNATIGSTKTPAFILEWGNFNANGSFAPGCIPVQLGTVTLPSN